MRPRLARLVRFASLALFTACSGPAPGPAAAPRPSAPPAPAAPDKLLPPSAFASIEPPAARSQALFAEASRVLLHARCVNCHPPDDSPRQGDAHAFHDPPAVRGPADRGVPAMQCGSCHQDQNLPYARVPGAPDWHLAPVEMAWLGRSSAQICAQLSDPRRNGQKTLAQIQHHLAHDALVGWGWGPGHGRSAPPGSQVELGALFQAWIDTGAVCPAGEEKRP